MNRLLCAVLALSYCNSVRTISADIELSLDSSQCPSANPTELTLDCGGSVGIFVVDVEATAEEGTEVIVESGCFPIPKEVSQLEQLPLTLSDFRSGFLATEKQVRVEIAVYSPPTAEDGGCPYAQYSDDDSLPVSTGGAIPAYAGRSEPIRLSADAITASVAMRCNYSPWCATPPQTIAVQTTVFDLRSLEPLDVKNDPATLGELFDARAAFVVHNEAQAGDGGEYLASAFLPLTFGGNNDPVWQANTQPVTFNLNCLGTLVRRQGESTPPLLSCEGSTSGVIAQPQAYAVDQDLLQDFLSAMDLQAAPNTGLVIGRVTNADGLPVEGARVCPTTGTADVVYFAAPPTELQTVSTSENGYFAVRTAALSQDAPCCDTWIADSPAGNGATSNPHGLVADTVSTLVIQVAQDQPFSCP